MVHVENFVNRFKARKFTVTQGGKSTGSKSSSGQPHPDIDAEVKRILDTIAGEGMDSLSASEKRLHGLLRVILLQSSFLAPN